MNRILSWIRFWWGLSKVSCQMAYMQERIDNLQKLRLKSDKEIEIHQEKLNVLQDKFHKELEGAKEALYESKNLNKKHEIELEAIYEELTTAKKIVIPGLIAANKTFVDAWDSQSSSYAAAQAMSGPSKDTDI